MPPAGHPACVVDSVVFAYGRRSSWPQPLLKGSPVEILEGPGPSAQDGIVDDDCAKVRGALKRPNPAGSWVRAERWSFEHRGWKSIMGVVHPPLRGVRRRRPRASRGPPAACPRRHRLQVGTVDASRSSPWDVQNVRFDGINSGRALRRHSASRSAQPGKKVLTDHFRAIHYHSLDLVNEPETWVEGAHADRREIGRSHPRCGPGGGVPGRSGLAGLRPNRRSPAPRRCPGRCSSTLARNGSRSRWTA